MGVKLENRLAKTWQSSLAKTWQSSVWQTSIWGDAPPQLNPSKARPRPLWQSPGKATQWQSPTGKAKHQNAVRKATRQLVLGRAVKLPGVRKSTVRCGHIVWLRRTYCQRPKLYWHHHSIFVNPESSDMRTFPAMRLPEADSSDMHASKIS